MKKIVIMLGIPGSGKGTQAKKLETDLNCVHISTGDLLRKIEKKHLKDEKHEDILNRMKQGHLIKDELIYKITFPKIKKALKEGKTVVLDGAVRSVDQAKEFDLLFEKLKISKDDIVVIEIHISNCLSKKRLHSRAIEAKKSGKEVRKDDTKKTIKERIKKQGNKFVRPVLKYYKKTNKENTFVLNGKKTIEEIAKKVSEIVSK